MAFDLSFFQSDWVTAVTGLMAFIAFGETLFRFGKNVIARPKIWFTPLPNCEVGYTQFGPTISLIGTLYSEVKGVFIENIILDVENTKTGEKMEFSWLISRDLVITAKENEHKITFMYAFFLELRFPRQINVVFRDSELHDRIFMTLSKSKEQFEKIQIKNPVPRMNAISKESRMAYYWQLFERSTEFFNTNKLLSESFPWKETEYAMEIRVLSKKKKFKIKNPSFRFSLTAKNIEDLKKNFPAIQKEYCGIAHLVEQTSVFPKLRQI